MRFFIPTVLVLFFVVPVFLPNKMVVSQEQTLPESRRNVYSKLVDLESWRTWGLWLLGQNNQEVTFEGTPGLVGSRLYGKGPGNLSGKITLTELTEPEKIVAQTQAQAFWPAEFEIQVLLSEQDQSTTWIKLTATAILTYPLQRYMGILKKDEFNHLLKQSLGRLAWDFEQERREQEHF